MKTIRDHWAISGGGGDRVEGWWVGETKFRLKEQPTSVLEPNILPSDILAVARAANARINVCPDDVGTRLPISRTDQVMAIAFPYWEMGGVRRNIAPMKGTASCLSPFNWGLTCLSRKISHCEGLHTVVQPRDAGLPWRRGRSPRTNPTIIGTSPHSRGPTFRWRGRSDVERRRLPSHVPSHLSVVGRSIPCVTR